MHVMDKGNLWCSVVFKVEDTKDERSRVPLTAAEIILQAWNSNVL
jgi:hypothetical protein